MRWLLFSLWTVAACATVPVSEQGQGPKQTVVVRGHVRSCAPVSVTVRVAGELDALGETQTDGEGLFQLEVDKASADLGLLVESHGVRTVATPVAKQLVAELAVPCGG
jgi:hypothetical protein